MYSYLKTFILLELTLIFYIKSCLSQSNGSADICDCNCDVQIGVIEHLLDKVGSLQQHLKQIDADLQKNQRLPTNCMDAAAGSFKSGIYKIQFSRFGEAPFTVWCDEDTDFGGWIVIQRRVSADVNFTRDWKEYKDGFGDLSGNYWIGLEKLHAFTASCEQELYIKMDTYDGEKYYIKYDLFVVGSAAEEYVLQKVGKGKGNVKDFFEPHKGSKFSTPDMDNDESSYCAKKYKGGWWYNRCYWCNLNGVYGDHGNTGLLWLGIEGEKPLKFVQMMIRPTEKCMKRLSLKNVVL